MGFWEVQDLGFEGVDLSAACLSYVLWNKPDKSKHDAQHLKAPTHHCGTVSRFPAAPILSRRFSCTKW